MAINGHWHRAVLQFLSFLPSHEGLQPETQWVTAFPSDTWSTLAVDQDGIYGAITHVRGLRLSISCNRLLHVTATSDTYNYTHYCQRGCVALLHRDHETPQPSPSYLTEIQNSLPYSGRNYTGSWELSFSCWRHSTLKLTVQLNGPINRFAKYCEQ